MRPRLTLLALLLAGGCTQPLHLTRDDSPVILARQTLDAPDPGLSGPYRVRTLYYGSGSDRRRAWFRDSVALRTPTVDGSHFLSLDRSKARSRWKYWGFDDKKLPLNARVWYPEGEGPFPLVLVVHGNHDMKQFSDPGYEYLGELLASRGYITASVDENFLNGDIRGENDARAWLLLEHLRRWRAWSDSSAGPFAHRVDMRHIALIGHSRGGEAVAHAATFNRLARYPDDATVKFDYGFGIASVIAIAPVDGQYKPAGQWDPLENVNYLVIHGSHDGDVSSFSWLRQYERLRFTTGGPWVKSAFYVYRANHGQWNSVWGNHDNGPRSGRYLDLRALLTPEEQRQFGRVVIGGFLEATLHGKREYLAMFRDHRTVGHWLPKTMYVTREQESSFRPIATFEEDVDVTTGTAPGVRIVADSLTTWREAPLVFRGRGDDPMNTNAVWAGWNDYVAGADSSLRGSPASLTFDLGPRPAPALDSILQGDGAVLVLSLAPTRDVPKPRAARKDSTKKEDSKSSKKSNLPPLPDAEHADSVPMELSIVAVDSAGHRVSLPLSRYGAVRRPLEAHILRRADQERARFARTWELVLQTYRIPLADFRASSPGFDPTHLRLVSLRFDRTRRGTVVVDDVGLTRD